MPPYLAGLYEVVLLIHVLEGLLQPQTGPPQLLQAAARVGVAGGHVAVQQALQHQKMRVFLQTVDGRGLCEMVGQGKC